jgi:hypothetical protein
MKFPDEFLGRCQTCLDNALLSSHPCPLGYGNGMPVNEDECMIRRARKQYLREQTTETR